MRRTLDLDSTCYHIKTICDEKGVTVEFIVGEMNVSKQAVYSWFSGKKMPSIDHLIELADILNASVDELLVTRSYAPEGIC
ncbi:MAG: helix-turn-helix domain-containing protein [Lachnospiraceae bacterium]|nr:helix-turn-helix domain-containing protein [Lachnospiraceae bacterium]